MSRFLKVKKNKKEEGITLIALITTIIVLLILAGISIGAITGSNGIIGQAQSAKEETEISQEKEIIDISTVEAIGKNNRGNLEEEEFQNALNSHTNGNVEVSTSGEEFEVFFEETNRYYTVDKNGNILDYAEVVIDNSPGDITKDENGEELAGTADEPYEIWCIEDLVEYSQITNSASAYTLADKYIKLCRTLNFKSKLSYVDSETTDYDEFLGGDGNTKLIEQLSENGKGFYPINGGTAKNTAIAKEFNGQGFKIENIYINQEEHSGFIGKASNICIKNLTITGTIISKNGSAGGICGCGNIVNSNNIIDNCHNYATVKSYSSNGSAGGIIGIGTATITNSSNYGEIIAEYRAGGLTGEVNGSTLINCSNFGTITANTNSAGGLLGFANSTVGEVNIYNSYNAGKISGQTSAGGIMGYIYASAKIKNVYNIGQVESKNNVSGGIVGGILWSDNPDIKIQYCYYLDNVEKGIGSTATDTTTKYQNDKIKSLDFLNELNENIKSIKNDGTDTSEWANWVSGENGYPIFE